MDLGASTDTWITATILITGMRDRCRIVAITPSLTFKGMKHVMDKATSAMRATRRAENTARDFQAADIPAVVILARGWLI
jgi:hypothetical protein